MGRYTKEDAAEMAAMIEEALGHVGFTGAKLARAPVSEDVLQGLREEEPDEEFDPVAFGDEIHYHRVTTDQGSFGIWFEPYPTLDLYGTELDLKDILPADADTEGMPEGWSLIGLDEETLERLFAAFEKKQRQP